MYNDTYQGAKCMENDKTRSKIKLEKRQSKLLTKAGAQLPE